MAFTINEPKKVLGISVQSLYCRVVPNISVDGKIHASVNLYADEIAYINGETINTVFDVVVLKQKYSEEDGLPIVGEFIEINNKRDISKDIIYVGEIENKSKNYLGIVTEKVIDHLVKIKFVSDSENIQIN